MNDIDVSVTSCEFSGISGHCVHCIGNAGLPLPKLSILSSNFTNNTNTAVNVEYCNITLSNVNYCNNRLYNEMISDGAAIRIFNGTVNMSTGTVLFYHNRAGNNGGAVYLNHSNLFASQGSVLFHNNTASNGGAVYIGEGSMLYVVLNTASIEFLGNIATYNGGALYVDLHYVNDAAVIYNLGVYYYNLLTENYYCEISNTADLGNCVYFNTQFLNKCFPVTRDDSFVSSSPCSISQLFYFDSVLTVTVNFTDSDIGGGFLNFWLHDLHLAVTIADSFGNPIGPLNASFWCCGDLTLYNCTIDSQWNNYSFALTTNDTIIECPTSDTITCNIYLTDHKHYLTSPDIYVAVERFQHNCNDVAHAIQPSSGICLPIIMHISITKKLCRKKYSSRLLV